MHSIECSLMLDAKCVNCFPGPDLGFVLLFLLFSFGSSFYWTTANLLHLAHVLYVQKRNA